jgi:hypothetical protein
MTEKLYLSLPTLKNEGEEVEYSYDPAAFAVPPDPSRLDLIGKGTTVGKLIERLKLFPGETRVMVRGYESGYDDPEDLKLIIVKPDPYDSSVYGNYEDAVSTDEYSFSVVLIDRP